MAEGARYRLPNEALLKALKAWDIPPVVNVETILGGFTSDTWRIQLSDNSSLVAKFTYDTEETFETQLRMNGISEWTRAPGRQATSHSR